MLLLFRTIFITGVLILSCTTKVSEWVLINVPAEEYRLVSFINQEGLDKASDISTIERELAGANVNAREAKTGSAASSGYELYFRNRLVKRYSSSDEIKDIVTSPLRRKISSEIMAGKLCVMLFLKTDDPAKDDRRREALLKAVKDSPFRDVIAVAELSRNNSEESNFVSMLLNVESDLKGIKDPMIFGIFGKFRALEPLVANGISAENIGYMIDFLTADCSCLIKDDLPGADILFKGSWDNPTPALVNRILDENPTLQHR
jgi:hypothetical protein